MEMYAFVYMEYMLATLKCFLFTVCCSIPFFTLDVFCHVFPDVLYILTYIVQMIFLKTYISTYWDIQFCGTVVW